MIGTIRQFGPWLALLYLTHRLLRAVSRGYARVVPYGLYAQPIGTGAFSAVRDDAATRLQEVGPDSKLLPPHYRPAAVLIERWRSGSRCFVLTHKGQFAGTAWCSRGAHDEDEVRCRWVLTAPDVSVWDFDIYIEPRLRMGRSLGRLWKSFDERLGAEGVRWSFSRISLFNTASVATHQRLGAVRIGTAVFVCLGPLQLAWLPRPPYLSLGARADHRPSVRLAPP